MGFRRQARSQKITSHFTNQNISSRYLVWVSVEFRSSVHFTWIEKLSEKVLDRTPFKIDILFKSPKIPQMSEVIKQTDARIFSVKFWILSDKI